MERYASRGYIDIEWHRQSAALRFGSAELLLRAVVKNSFSSPGEGLFAIRDELAG